MTGRNMIETALKLLGYTESNGNSGLSQRVLNKATPLLNVIYSELAAAEGVYDFKPIKSLADNIYLSNKTLNDIMPTGVAMMIAQSESDTEQQQMWTEIYNQKRSSLTKLEEKVNVVPTISDY